MRFLFVLILTLTLGAMPAMARQQDSTVMQPKDLANYLATVSQKYQGLDASLEKQFSKTISRLQKHERRLVRKLARKDTVAAKQLAANSEKYYAALQAKMNGAVQGKTLKEYIPAFDTVKTSLQFLSNRLPGNDPRLSQLKDAAGRLQGFEQRMQLANELKKQLKERKQQLAARLEQFGMVKDLKKLNKEVYYYQQQLGEYKAILKDPKKMERKALALLRENKLFKEFMKKNSMLAKLFRLPGENESSANVAGLQTQVSVQALVTQRFGGAGIDPRQYVQQQMKQAQSEVNALQNKVKKLGGDQPADADMPTGFTPNTQKTKSFLQRLEYGADVQSQKLNSHFPATTDIALTIGYKLNDKSVLGIGASYKFGLGSIQHIELTHEGMGMRSYLDWKIKGSFWITGGYEQNYLQRFSGLRETSNVSVWRQSALVGMTKKIKTGKKSSKVELLYDFLCGKDNIRTQPFVFRVGYNF